MQNLWPRIRGLFFFGWCIVLIRFILDATIHPEEGWNFGWLVGVDVLMPLAFIVYGFRGTLDDLRWPKFILIAFLLGLLVWGIPNLIIYTTAQFQGWTFGRFEPVKYDQAGHYVRGHAQPIADTSLGKLRVGLVIAGMTTVFSTVGGLVTATLFIWLPGFIRRKRARSAG